MKKLTYIILVLSLFLNTGCATIFCDLLCEDDTTCYTICRGFNDAFEGEY